MTGLPAIQADLTDERAVHSADRRGRDIGDFLAAVAMSIRDSVARFEDTVGGITDIVVRQPGGGDRALVMTLQNFDRLQQEFATLADVLARVSAAPDWQSGEMNSRRFCREVIESITVAELKQRLAYHFNAAADDPSQTESAEDVEF